MRLTAVFFKKVTKVTCKLWPKILGLLCVRPSHTRGQEAQNFRVSLGFVVGYSRVGLQPALEGDMTATTSMPARC